MIEVNFVETNKSFKGKIYLSISNQLNKLLFRKKGVIIREIKQLVPLWVKEQPEMQEIKSGGVGSLAAQLGIVFGDGEEAVEAIANAVADSVAIDITKISPKTLQGGIKAKFMPATFADLLSLPQGKVTTEKGEELHWLKWLLIEGFSAIVVGYSFQFKRAGRSGGGYMKEKGIWRVPPQYAGTPEDNFITRALTGPSRDEQISRIFQRHIK